MCGFIGCVHENRQSETEDEKILQKMNNLITHRGPDDKGYFQDEHVKFGFAG